MGMNQKLGEYKTGSLVWPGGKALDWQAEGPRFDFASALLSLQKLCVCGHCLVALRLVVSETLKWLQSLHNRSGSDSGASVKTLSNILCKKKHLLL